MEDTDIRYLDPMIIPEYGCSSFNNLGERCLGSTEIDRKEYCHKCLCFSEKAVQSDKSNCSCGEGLTAEGYCPVCDGA